MIPSFGRWVRSLCPIELLATVLVAGSVAHAQQANTWQRVANFSGSIGCGFFFDEEHGLVGSGVRWNGRYALPHCAIYKTTDGGTTWTASQVPGLIGGAVTSIWMQDTLTGYASILTSTDYSIQLTFGSTSLWKTTDGGNTWFDPFHLDHAMTCVYAQNGLLIFTAWDNSESYNNGTIIPNSPGGAYSYDGGQSWTGNFRRGNGIAFSDSLNGLVTEMNPSVGGGNFWCTFDAGQTWQMTTAQYESWSVYAQAGTRTYFCANESQPGLPSASVNWSTDGGLKWRERYRFGSMRFTGTVAGKGSTLYVQTDSTLYDLADGSFSPLQQYGLFRSDDLGASWHWINGPSNSRDSRFCVTGCSGEVVYAFDAFGGVWKTIDGGDGTLPGGNPRDASFMLSADTIVWAPAPCGDSLSFLATSSSCVPMTLDSAACLQGDLFWRADSALPIGLAQNDSARIAMRYDPIRMANDTSLVRVYGHSGSRPITRDLRVLITNNFAEGLTLTRDSSAMQTSGCTVGEDTIGIGGFGCGSMVLDSIVVPSEEVAVSNHVPDTIPGKSLYLLHLYFAPDSVGLHLLPLHLYVHAGRRHYDTTIAVTAEARLTPPAFVLDSTSLAFATKYCAPLTKALGIMSAGCDTITVDSLVVSNPAFSLVRAPNHLTSSTRDSIQIVFGPDSIGSASATLHVFGHTRRQTVDTLIFLSGINAGHPEALTLSRNALALQAIACKTVLNSLVLSNQGCDLLYLDSIVAPNPISVAFDTTRFPMASNDSLALAVQFIPQDSTDQLLPLRLIMHTSKRKIDTTLWVRVSNHIPANPLLLSTDSVRLFTKYCQPITTQLVIENAGCNPMMIDSLVLYGDVRHEFTSTLINTTILGQDQTTASLQFTPDTSGERSLQMHLYIHTGAKARDTILALNGENHTAPEPYLPALPSLAASAVLRIPVMLRPTLDTFTMGSYAFHLHHNTDLLTPFALDFNGTCGQFVTGDTLTMEPGSGTSVRVHLSGTITRQSRLDLPLVYVLDSVRLAPDTITEITIDSFATDVEPKVIACSIPGAEFALAPACGNPMMLDLLRSQPLMFDIKGISPNPSGSAKTWKLDYTVRKGPNDLSVILYDAQGKQVYRSAIAASGAGSQSASVPVPIAEGDYFLVLASATERMARKVTVRN